MRYFSKDRFCNFNLHYDTFYSLKYFCECMEKLGIRNVELIAGHPSLFIDHHGICDLTETKKLLREHGLKTAAISAQSCRFRYQFAVREPEVIEQTFAFFSNGIRVAAELGAGILQVNPGWGYWDEPREEALKRSADMFSRLCTVAEQCGVRMACETLRPQESIMGYRLQDVKEIYDKVDHPCFKAMIDTCAMGVAGETIQDWFDAFGSENIIHTHFIDGTPYFHMIWGEGRRNLGADLKALYDNHYQGLISQELTVAGYYLDPFEYDRKNLRFSQMTTHPDALVASRMWISKALVEARDGKLILIVTNRFAEPVEKYRDTKNGLFSRPNFYGEIADNIGVIDVEPLRESAKEIDKENLEDLFDLIYSGRRHFPVVVFMVRDKSWVEKFDINYFAFLVGYYAHVRIIYDEDIQETIE